MKKFSTNKRLIILLISVIIFLGLIAFSLNSSGNSNFLQRTGNDITAMVGRVLSVPANTIDNLFDDITDLRNTYTENERLKREINSVYETQAELVAVKADNKELQEELDIESSLTEYETFHSAVIARNPDSWIENITIDSGSTDGVVIGMPVMSDGGLIGRISEVSPSSSKVQLITTSDQRSNLVSAEVITEEDDEVVHGVIDSYDEETERLVMEQITSDIELEEGQTVITSGLSGKTPRSLVIGEVDEVALGDFGLTQRVYVTPAADFNEIRYVTIINRLAENGE